MIEVSFKFKFLPHATKYWWKTNQVCDIELENVDAIPIIKGGVFNGM